MRLGTGTSCACAMFSCGIQMFFLIISPIYWHIMLQNSVWQNTIHKNPLATMRDLQLQESSCLKLQNPFFTVMWDVLWMAIWLINLMQNESNSYTMFTWYTGMNSPRYDLHCYEILCCNHVTNTEKQEGTGVNLYQNEKHTNYELVSCKHPLRLKLSSSQECLTTSSDAQGQ